MLNWQRLAFIESGGKHLWLRNPIRDIIIIEFLVMAILVLVAFPLENKKIAIFRLKKICPAADFLLF